MVAHTTSVATGGALTSDAAQPTARAQGATPRPRTQWGTASPGCVLAESGARRTELVAAFAKRGAK